MDIRTGENKRESWWVTNNTDQTITIGDLFLVPAIKPGKKVDLLHHYTREKISHSTMLVKMVKAGIVSLNKDKIFSNEFPGEISSSIIDEAITPGEENEILKESEADDIYLKLDGSNANQNIGINDFGLQEVGFIDFDLTSSASHSEGRLKWNNTDKTLQIDTEQSDVQLQIGQEMYVRIVNKTGSQINNGQIVYINGAQGNRPTVTLAKADSKETSMGTLGFATHDIPSNQNGYITSFGLVRDLDTTSFSEGDMIYLSPTTAGEFTTTTPSAPNHSVALGIVIASDLNNGIIFARIDNGHEIEELHNVFVSNITDNDVLQYDQDTLIWKNIEIDLFASTLDHNNLGNLQGGNPSNNEFYHVDLDDIEKINYWIKIGNTLSPNEDGTNLEINGNISLLSNTNKLYLGLNQDSSIFFDGTDLNISVGDNPSLEGLIKLNDDVTVAGVLKTLSGKIINRTSVTTSPYNILESDNHISVTTSSITITLNLPLIINGAIYHIKDQDEQSSARNITVNPNGSDTIENASNLTIKVNGASITIVGNSATNNWEIQ